MSHGARNPRPAGVRAASAPDPTGAAVAPRVEPIASPESFKRRAYAALKDAIAAILNFIAAVMAIVVLGPIRIRAMLQG